MEETPRQAAAFLYYATMPKRNLRQFAKDFGISMSTAGVWSKALDWQGRVKLFDFKTSEQLENVVIGDWVETKAYLLRVLMKQVVDGVSAGIKPRNTTEMVAAIREIRSMMGDDIPEELMKREGIVFTRVISDATDTGHSDL